MHREVVDAGARDRTRVFGEVDDPGARHLERADLTLHRAHHRRGVAFERGRAEVAVEEVVTVLVARDPLHHFVRGRVAADLAGVVMGDARRELLERDVDHAVFDGRRVGDLPALDLGHACPFQRDGIDRAGHREVVAQHDGVATLLGGPAPDPRAPGAVGPEAIRDLRRVVGEVVLGEEVHEQGAADGRVERDLVFVPRLAGREVPAARPRHELVREPLLGAGQVALEQALGDRGEVGHESRAGVRSMPPSLPTSR